MTLPGLDALRGRIDEIDQQILRLLEQRVQLVLEIGELKRRHQAEIYDPERERRMLEALARAAEPPLHPATARRVFERIIDEMRSQEQRHVSAPPPKR